jgi:Terminase DNA packaging enzyme
MSTFDKLDETFNIVPTEVEETSVEIVKSTEPKKDLQNDYEYSRGQLYNLIEKGQEAINGIMDVAQQSDHPRAYEVALQGIKNVADMTDKLIDLQKKMKEIDEEKQKGPSTVNNTMFVGSTADLQKFLKQSKLNNIEE